MRIVNTFISEDDTIPEYTEESLYMARKNNPYVKIDFICKSKQQYFNKYDINWVPQSDLANGDILNKFNKVCKFNRHGKPKTTYPCNHDFWHRTAERIFYLQEHISRNKII